MEEIWKDIKGYEGLYQISNHGRVHYPDKWRVRDYSHKKGVLIRIRPAGILKLNTNRLHPRAYLRKSKNESIRSFLVCELVAEHFIDGYKKGMKITHIDGDVTNNKVTNLYISLPDKIDGEVWKPIQGFEGLYQVSNTGRVRSVKRNGVKFYVNGHSSTYFRKGKILKQSLTPRGYYMVQLHKQNERTQYCFVHRLVAMAFCDGYGDGLVVNHKDENTKNNRADNLEWCTSSYNTRYGSSSYKIAKSKMKKVAKYDKNGTILKTYNSIMEAVKLEGHSRNSIASWASGKIKCMNGYIWKFID